MKWTQSVSAHLNGGSKFSQLNFNIFYDGQPTNIIRVTRTSGPKYLKTVDRLECGDQTFDVLATRGIGMEDWLTSVFTPSQPTAREAATQTVSDQGGEA